MVREMLSLGIYGCRRPITGDGCRRGVSAWRVVAVDAVLKMVRG